MEGVWEDFEERVREILNCLEQTFCRNLGFKASALNYYISTSTHLRECRDSAHMQESLCNCLSSSSATPEKLLLFMFLNMSMLLL